MEAASQELKEEILTRRRRELKSTKAKKTKETKELAPATEGKVDRPR